MPLNDIFDTWLSAFLDQRDPETTDREARFAAALLAPGSRVLDLACRFGRHAEILTSLGFAVVGLDRDGRVLDHARRVCPVVQAEMRRPPFSSESFDAVLSMWQSFGYFSAAENTALLRELARIAKPRGLQILDLYNRAFFESAPDERRFVRAGTPVREITSLVDDRLNVKLAYHDGAIVDEFEWQVFTPRALQNEALATGWAVVGQFADFDLTRRADEDTPRIQYVLQRQRNCSMKLSGR